MTTTLRFIGLLVITLASLVAILGLGSARPASAAGTTIHCEIPLAVECEVSNPDGIAHVEVTMMTGFGEFAVVDQSFNCQTSVMVSWDPIVPNFDIDVETCGGFHFAPKDNDAGRDSGGRGMAKEELFYSMELVDSQREPATELLILVTPRIDPGIGNFKAEPVYLHDFHCGGGLVPCDDTFKDFCAIVAGGTYRDLDGGYGACITPGGWNPDGAP